VISVSIESRPPINTVDLQSILAQELGQPLERARVAEGLKQLYATGRFDKLRADVQQEKAGVVLIFVAEPKFFVGLVRVTGNPKALDTSLLRSASRLRLGEALSNEELESAKQRIERVLAENAYYQASVEYHVERLPNQETDITFIVTAGLPARLSGVDFRGHPLVSAQQLQAITTWTAGTHLTQARLERGLSRLRHFYEKRKHLEAMVSYRSRTPGQDKTTERLVVEIEAGPVVEVRVRGAHVSATGLHTLLPIYNQGLIDELDLEAGKRNLQDHFERQGYYLATVVWSRRLSQQGQNLEITYTINPGPLGEFVGQAFKRNKLMGSEQVSDMIAIKPKNFHPPGGIFSQQLLEQSVQAVTAYYHSHGYAEVKITPKVDNRYEGQPGRLFVTLEIDEGPNTVVRDLALLGVDEKTRRAIQSLILTNPGRPYSPEVVRRDEDAILTYLGNQGQNHTTVTSRVAVISEPPGERGSNLTRQVDLEYEIKPGPKEKVGRIIIMGNTHTRESVVERQLTFESGEPLTESALLESQRRLYDLGVFTQVQVAHQDPATGRSERTVLVSVEEAERWTLTYGGGLDFQRLQNNAAQGEYSLSPRVGFEAIRSNVGGRAQTASFRGRFSDVEKGAVLNYTVPRFLNQPEIGLRFTALAEQTRDVLTFTEHRQEGDIAVERHSSASTYLIGRYSFRHITVSELRINPETIPLYSQPEHLAMISGTYLNDHRDNPADATKGTYTVVDLGVAAQALGSQSNFARLSAQNATYYALKSRFVLARNTRIGLASTFGAPSTFEVTGPTGQPETITTHFIPLPERFFEGGSESHRGFALNQGGPRDPVTGYPIGGNAMFLNTVELRWALVASKYGLVFFHDAGNVFSSARRMKLLKFTQNSPTDLDYDVLAVGVGLRYNTPVGPLRFDVGYDINPPRFQTVNNGVVGIQQLSHLQVFLSVGQSF
jgi:outer membrane protein assembly complex protein YaeT